MCCTGAWLFRKLVSSSPKYTSSAMRWILSQTVSVPKPSRRCTTRLPSRSRLCKTSNRRDCHGKHLGPMWHLMINSWLRRDSSITIREGLRHSSLLMFACRKKWVATMKRLVRPSMMTIRLCTRLRWYHSSSTISARYCHCIGTRMSMMCSLTISYRGHSQTTSWKEVKNCALILFKRIIR